MFSLQSMEAPPPVPPCLPPVPSSPPPDDSLPLHSVHNEYICFEPALEAMLPSSTPPLSSSPPTDSTPLLSFSPPHEQQVWVKVHSFLTNSICTSLARTQAPPHGEKRDEEEPGYKAIYALYWSTHLTCSLYRAWRLLPLSPLVLPPSLPVHHQMIASPWKPCSLAAHLLCPFLNQAAHLLCPFLNQAAHLLCPFLNLAAHLLCPPLLHQTVHPLNPRLLQAAQPLSPSLFHKMKTPPM